MALILFLLQHSTVSELQKFRLYRAEFDSKLNSRIDKRFFLHPVAAALSEERKFSREEKSSDKKNATRRKRMLSGGCELTWPISTFFRLSTFLHKFNRTRLYDNDGSKAKREKKIYIFIALSFSIWMEISEKKVFQSKY